MDGEAVILRRELARHERGRGKRYDVALKRRVQAWISRRRQAGATLATIGAEVGLGFETVRRWLRADLASAGKLARRSALVPVRVIDEPRAVRTVSVVSPSGFRVDGVTLAEAAAMLRALA